MNTINYINNDERTMSMLCHLLALAGYVIPFGAILGPLIIWLSKKDQYPEVDRQGKDALNFHLSMLIYSIVAGVLVLILIGLLFLVVIVVFRLVMIIIASMKSNNGERFEYPLSLRIIY
jgi:hypothetical protein